MPHSSKSISHSARFSHKRCVLSGDATYTLEGRALLADVSAKVLDSDAIKKTRVE
jgi:hypothetical protein